MKNISPLLFVPLLLSLLVLVQGLELAAQPQTLANGTTLVFWARQPSDPTSFTFDLRFACGSFDEGLALPNIHVDATQTFGSVPVVFPFPGVYSLKAVTEDTNTVIGTSNVITAVAPLLPLPPAAQVPMIPAAAPTLVQSSPAVTTQASTTTTATQTTTLPIPSPTVTPGQHSSTSVSASIRSSATSLHPTPTSSPATALERRGVNLPAVVGGVIGSLALLGLLAAVFVFLARRKRDAVRRYTFHRDMMVQPRNDSDPSLPHVTVVRNTAPFDHDLETGSIPPAVPPKLSVVPAGPSAFHRDHDRMLSPVTPRTKRNFPDATFTPAGHEREDDLPAPSISSVPSSAPSIPAPVFPRPFLLKSTNPFVDVSKEPEMMQVPPPPSPSPRIPSSTVAMPSPRGPRPSVKRLGNSSTTDLGYPGLPVRP